MLQPKDIDWLNGYKNKTYVYVVYKRPTSDLGTHYRLKVRGWKKNIPCKWKPRESKGSYTHIREIDFEPKTINKSQRRLLYNDKGDNSSRGYNICKYLCILQGTPKFIKEI